MRRRPAALHRDEGTGLISALAGFTVFLVLLFGATHLLVHLYTRSVVTAAAFDAARIASGAASQDGAEAAAGRHVHDLLGRYAQDPGSVVVTVTVDDDWARVVVDAKAPTLSWPGFSMLGTDRFTREVKVRREIFRD